MSNESALDFSTCLASLVHDMKNSIGMLLNTTDEIIDRCSSDTCPSYPLLSQLLYESKRANNNLIQLLTLYKMDKAQLTMNIDYNDIGEFINEIILYNKPLLDSRGIRMEIDTPDNLLWFLDKDLIGGVINNVLNNAFRYTRDNIKISSRKDERGYLIIQIEDNGTGYPEQMINTIPDSPSKNSFLTGGTGLGLYFAYSVVKLHKDKDREGYILINNNPDQGGGCFSIFLP
jgi:two-component system, OmpR family, sensor histidine kinase SenX3